MPISNPFLPKLPAKAGQRLRWHGLHGSAPALAVAATAAHHTSLVLVVAPDPLSAQRFSEEVQFFSSLPLLQFPDWETLPYDLFSPHQDIISERLTTLFHLPALRTGILVLPITTLMQRLPPTEFVQEHTLILRQGDSIDRQALRLRLEHSGYRDVRQVLEHGECAVRGSVMDLFPMGSSEPYRIDWLDEQIDSIRRFDPETQRSRREVAEIRLLPAREFPIDGQALARFNQRWQANFGNNTQESPIYQDVNQGLLPAGIEYYLPFFCPTTACLFDYLPQDCVAILLPQVARNAEAYAHEARTRYEQLRHNRLRPLLPPEQLFLKTDEVFAHLKAYRQAAISDTGTQSYLVELDGVADNHEDDFIQADLPGMPPIPALAVAPLPKFCLEARSHEPLAALRQFLAGFQGRVLFSAETTGRRESLLELLQKQDIHPQLVDSWQDFSTGTIKLGLTIAPLEHGVLLHKPALAIIPESQLLGRRVPPRRREESETQRDPDAIIRNLTELDLGAPVVHQNHGVGRYLGLQPLSIGGMTTEFLHLEYAKGDKLYVPVTSLHLISRYTGIDPEHAPLHQLGSGQWEKARKKAQEKISDVAAELLELYARRATRQGHRFQHDPQAYRTFVQGFPFDETPDQQAAIDAVLADMHSPRPMDRLVCGDVGFGKTEVAMRAAFVAVQDGRQVAVLVPTTLLAQQHYQTFSDRFADWPVRIEQLSRFSAGKQTTATLDALAQGKVDIVIGTHKLLQKSVRFRHLGLVIIDEEHRFGVKQKETFKSLRAEVDILTLTATPIPRSLNMAMAAIRDLSIIATAPSKRLAIKTFVTQWNPETLAEALLRELKRGGQVFFVHNRVEDIEKIADEVAKLVPQARVDIAHGQMAERQLERVMSDFYHRRFNVLVCTTIIETGIDIPSANTIVINRADRFGLAQLYQLRGRVGRSHHRAYSYLITPPKQAMTPDAAKRIEAISALEELGVGFTLATHDLEIRGAGELLGSEQSGNLQEIGFSLYTQLLERAVEALKSGKIPQLDHPLDAGTEVDLRSPALLPEGYIPDVHQRLILYKRIAGAKDNEGLRELKIELIDRFGLLPPPTVTLFETTAIKLKAMRLGIRKIELGTEGGRLLFIPKPPVDPMKVIQLVQQDPYRLRLDKENNLHVHSTMNSVAERVQMLHEIFNKLTT